MNYKAIIPYKIKDLLALIMNSKQVMFLEAIDYLYSSKLYEYLSNEETKFWHFSTAKLFDILEGEKHNTSFNISDYV